MNGKHNLKNLIFKTFPVMLILLLIFAFVLPPDLSAQTSPESKTEKVKNDVFGERFREGRDLIDRQQWAQAAEKFSEAVEKSPDHKLADVALYWLAFCYKKQKKFEQADITLDRLLKDFPASDWIGDAEVMKMEILPLLDLAWNNNNNSNAIEQKQFSSDLNQQQKIINGKNVSGQNTEVGDKLSAVKRLPLDRADEIRIAAFQSLLFADPKRAIETTGDILKSDSAASENLKRKILRLWRNQRIIKLTQMTANSSQPDGNRDFMSSLLRETLIKGFRSEKNLKTQIEIIYTLASFADAESLEFLKNLYATENSRDIRRDIINAMSVTANVFYPFSADIAPEKKGQPNPALERAIQARADFLFEIIRVEKDSEFRQLAISNLNRFRNWQTNARILQTLIGLYDAETNEDFKVSLVRTIADFKQPAATRKLLDIAKNDKSDKLRLEAIYSLQTSKDPEVIKFLQDLIR